MAQIAQRAFQDCYADDVAHCFGCGRLNPHGHQIKSYWDGESTVAHFVPAPFHTAIPGYVYGGLLASLIDCHGTGTAAAVAATLAGVNLGTDPVSPECVPRFVSAALHVDYLRPTPLGPVLELRGVAVETTDRKVTVDVEIRAGGTVTVRGRVIAVRMPSSMQVGR